MFVRCCVNEEMNNTTLCIPSPKGLIDLFCSMFYFVNILSACHAGMTYMSGMQIDSISYHDSYKWVLPVLRRILRLHWDKAERVSQLISSRVLPWVRHLPFQLWGTWLYMGKFFSASWGQGISFPCPITSSWCCPLSVKWLYLLTHVFWRPLTDIRWFLCNLLGKFSTILLCLLIFQFT